MLLKITSWYSLQKKSSMDFDMTHPTGEEPTVDAPGLAG